MWMHRDSHLFPGCTGTDAGTVTYFPKMRKIGDCPYGSSAKTHRQSADEANPAPTTDAKKLRRGIEVFFMVHSLSWRAREEKSLRVASILP
jgi:hypothetical protein